VWAANSGGKSRPETSSTPPQFVQERESRADAMDGFRRLPAVRAGDGRPEIDQWRLPLER